MNTTGRRKIILFLIGLVFVNVACSNNAPPQSATTLGSSGDQARISLLDVSNGQSITIVPTTMTFGDSRSQQFVATVSGLANTNVTWSFLNGYGLGTLSSTGLYQPPPSHANWNTFSIVATSVENPSLSAQAKVSLAPYEASAGPTATPIPVQPTATPTPAQPTATPAQPTATPTPQLTPIPSQSSANFLGTDLTSQGTWQGRYGNDGYIIEGDSQQIPAYAAVSVTGTSSYTWVGNTTDVRALQWGSSATHRIASFVYSSTSFPVDVNIIDGQAHKISMYLLDWDGNNGRAETIQAFDATTGNAIDAAHKLVSFSNGAYASWMISGHVVFKITNVGNPYQNVGLSAVFFDRSSLAPVPTVTPIVGPTATPIPTVIPTPTSTPPPPPNTGSIQIIPNPFWIVNATPQFILATVTGLSDARLLWSINPAIGSIDARTGVYTPPPSSPGGQSTIVTATSVANPAISGSGLIKLIPYGSPGTSPTPTPTPTAPTPTPTVVAPTPTPTPQVLPGGGVARPSYNLGKGFFVANGKLYDPNGFEFRVRGVNKAHWDVWSSQLPNSRANTVRWSVDFTRPPQANIALLMGGPGQNTGTVNDHIVVMPGMWYVPGSPQAATCADQDVAAPVSGMALLTPLMSIIVNTWVSQAKYWTQLEKYSIINIANEWGPSNSTVWRDNYIQAIAALRAAGYHATISVTSGGCGQDYADIAKYARDVFNSDPEKNVIFDLHIYNNFEDLEDPLGPVVEPYTVDLPPAAAALAQLGLPIIFGEFGPGKNIGFPLNLIRPHRIMEIAEQNNFGWLAWAWDDGANTNDWFAMSYTGLYLSTSDLTMYGQQVIEGCANPQPGGCGCTDPSANATIGICHGTFAPIYVPYSLKALASPNTAF